VDTNGRHSNGPLLIANGQLQVHLIRPLVVAVFQGLNDHLEAGGDFIVHLVCFQPRVQYFEGLFGLPQAIGGLQTLTTSLLIESMTSCCTIDRHSFHRKHAFELNTSM
jgi:hypothetical protein